MKIIRDFRSAICVDDKTYIIVAPHSELKLEIGDIIYDSRDRAVKEIEIDADIEKMSFVAPELYGIYKEKNKIG